VRSKSGFIFMIIIFVVLLGIVLMQNKKQERTYKEQQEAKNIPFFPDFNPDAVANIKVTKINDSLDFKREGGYWMVANTGMSPQIKENMEKPKEGEQSTAEVEETRQPEENYTYYRADETQVTDGILKAIKDLKREEHVSRDKESHTKFYVSPIVGIDVTAEDTDGNVLAHFIVGKASDMTSTSNYVRQADEDDVYEVRQGLQNLFNKPFNAWRDKTMYQFDKSLINKILFVGTPDGDVEFTKDDSGAWHNETIEWPFDEAKINTAIETMSYLKALDFASPHIRREDTGLDESTKKVVVSGTEGSYELIIGNATKDGKYNCSTGIDDSIYMAKESDIKAIFLERQTLEKSTSQAPTEQEQAKAE